MGLCASSLGPVPDVVTFYDLPPLPDIDGNPVDFAQLKGKVVLVCNTASKWGGYRDAHLKDFRLLLEAYASRGLVIIACPCNQFLNQEPGSPEAVKAFLRSRRFNGIIMGKADVNGRRSSPLIAFLKKASGDTSPLPWNYTKFLVGRDGRVYGRYLPRTRPAELEPSIRRLLAEAEEPGGGAPGGVPRSASGSTVRPAEHGGMVGVLVDGIGREVKEFLLHPKEDDLLPSQRAAAATASAAAADAGGGGDSGGSSQPPVGLVAAAPAGPAGEAAAAGAAPVHPAAAVVASPVVAAAAGLRAQQPEEQQQEQEHLPVLERVLREAPGEVSNC